ncbi:uncharacterized protein LOC126824016 isoform X2 [Patella vulgata]|uniref:uncharacterized protein LOC126824016 isoform X2 n=1 Tax=Patella vulgata TaxID=6465 RepID=UPI0024A9DAC8|nr:uncharacterized protein LOC126824016 isoform X2 [Patella vulgata]
MEKLPFSMRDRWRRKAHNCQINENREARYKDFVEFVNYEVDVMTDPVFGRTLDKTPERVSRPTDYKLKQYFGTGINRPQQTSVPVKSVNPYNTEKCDYCLKGHNLDLCQDFMKLSYSDRRKFAIVNNMCFGCLGRFHESKNCRFKRTCRKCGKNHPTVLHADYFTNPWLNAPPASLQASGVSYQLPSTPFNAQTSNAHQQMQPLRQPSHYPYQRPPNAMYQPNVNYGNRNLSTQHNASQQNISRPNQLSSNVPNLSNGCIDTSIAPNTDRIISHCTDDDFDVMMSIVPGKVISKDSNASKMTYIYIVYWMMT